MVEDDDDLRDITALCLEAEGWVVDGAGDAEMGWALARTRPPDLMLIDVMLPRQSGLDLCRRIRGDLVTKHLPMIVLTTMTRQEDVNAGLRAGADDYMCKPYDVEELILRCRRLLKRVAPAWVLQDMKWNPETGELRIGEQDIFLTRVEARIMRALWHAQSGIVPRDKLAKELFGSDDIRGLNALKVHVSRLRAKLLVHRNAVETVPGRGLRLRRPDA